MTSFSSIHSTDDIKQMEELLRKDASQLASTDSTSISFEEIWINYKKPKFHFNPLLYLYKFRYKWRVTWVGFVVICICISMTAIAFPAIGETLRGLSLVQRLYNQGNLSLDYEQIDRKHLTDSVNHSVLDQGIELRVDELFYDGLNVVISYTVIDTEGKQRIQGSNPGPWLEYDFSGLSTDGILIEPHNRLIDSNLLEGTAVISFVSNNLPDQMNIMLSSKRITDTMGDWGLNISASIQRSKKYVQTLYPKTSIDLAGNSIQIQKMILGPVSNQITLKGANINAHWDPLIRLFDDKGLELKHTGQSGGVGMQYSSFDPFSEQNPHPAYITVIIEEPISYNTVDHSTNIKPKIEKVKVKLNWD